jgi:recombination protein RecA
VAKPKSKGKSDEGQALITPAQLRAALVKRWGAGAVRMASDPSLQITRLPTGILSLDMGLSGGVARGRYTEIYGSYSVGKTLVANKLIAETQLGGGRCAYYDAENAFDPRFAAALGVDLEELEFQDQREHGNKVIDHMEALLRSGLYDVIVLDSIAALLPKAEQESDMEAASMGMEQAKMMSKALRKLTAANQKTALVFINQTRQAVGASAFAKQSVTSGGKAMGFYAGTRLELVRTENIKEPGQVINMTNGDVVKKDLPGGHRVLVRVEKDKTSSAMQNAETTFVYRYKKMEVDRVEDLVYLGRVTGLVHKKGTSWWVDDYEDEMVSNGRPGIKKYLKKNVAVADELEARIREFYNRGTILDSET